jgi:ankyrin repeat protein
MVEGIWRAACDGDLAEVQRLVGQDPRLLDAKDGFLCTPLIRAAGGGHVEVVRWLVDQGAALEEKSRDEWTAVYLASRDGHTAVVRLLLEKGADPTVPDRSGQHPLIKAAQWGFVEITRCLLDHPSAATFINIRDKRGRTALWWACGMGRTAVVRALLERGADPTTADNYGKTPMATAKMYNRPACIEALKVRCSIRPFPLLRVLTGGSGVFSPVGLAGRRRSGPTCCGRPGRWPMRLRASRRL